jgi:hypothetical protein
MAVKFRLAAAVLCVWCVGWCSARALHAADDAAPSQKSALDERQEEERKLTSSRYTNLPGTIKLLTDAEIQTRGDAEVIAKFATEGKDFFLKPDTETVKAEIKKSDGKTLTLKGKALEDGKYVFVLRSVVEGPGNGFVPAGGGSGL